MVGVILLVSFLLRVIGITHGLPFVYEHDELNTVMAALRYGTGNFVPPMFFHGGFTSYLLFVIFAGTYAVNHCFGVWRSGADVIRQFAEDPTIFYVIGRMMVVFLGVLSVWTTYRAGTRLASKAAGLIASAIVGVSVLQVNLSHLIKEDIIASAILGMTFLMVVRTLIRIEQGGGSTFFDYLVVGFGIGLACSAKYYAAVALVWVLLLIAADRTLRRNSVGVVSRLAVAAGGVLVGFGVGNPYAFLHVRDFLHDFVSMRRAWEDKTSNADGLSSIRLYARYLLNSVGLPIAIAAVGGVIVGCRRAWRWRALFIAAFVVVFMGILLTMAATPHYLTPVIPFVALLAALFFQWLSEIATPRRWVVRCVYALGVMSLIPTLLDSVRYDLYAMAPDTRAIAKAWIETNIPANERIAVEGAMSEEIVLGPPLEANRHTLEEELKDIQRRGGNGRLWRARLTRADTSTYRQFSLCKARQFTESDLERCHASLGVIVTDSFDRGLLRFSTDRSRFLHYLEQHSQLVTQFDPYPGMRDFPSSWALRYDFPRLRLVGFFNNPIPLVTGPRIRVVRLHNRLTTTQDHEQINSPR